MTRIPCECGNQHWIGTVEILPSGAITVDVAVEGQHRWPACTCETNKNAVQKRVLRDYLRNLLGLDGVIP